MKRIPSAKLTRNEPRRVAIAGAGVMNHTISTTQTAVTAFAIMQAGTPTAAMTRPAIGGPITAGPLNASELSPIALPIISRGTSSDTQLWRAGLSNDCAAAVKPLIAIKTGSEPRSYQVT